MGRNQPKNKMGLLSTGPMHSNTLINFPVTVHMHSNRVIIILTLTKQTEKLHSAGGYSSIKVGGLTVQVN